MYVLILFDIHTWNVEWYYTILYSIFIYNKLYNKVYNNVYNIVYKQMHIYFVYTICKLMNISPSAINICMYI